MFKKMYWKFKIDRMSNEEFGRNYRALYNFKKVGTKEGAMVLSLMNRNSGKRMDMEEFASFAIYAQKCGEHEIYPTIKERLVKKGLIRG